LKEILRLYPPAPLLGRVAIENTEISGFKIPKETEIIINVWTRGYRSTWFW